MFRRLNSKLKFRTLRLLLLVALLALLFASHPRLEVDACRACSFERQDLRDSCKGSPASRAARPVLRRGARALFFFALCSVAEHVQCCLRMAGARQKSKGGLELEALGAPVGRYDAGGSISQRLRPRQLG